MAVKFRLKNFDDSRKVSRALEYQYPGGIGHPTKPEYIMPVFSEGISKESFFDILQDNFEYEKCESESDDFFAVYDNDFVMGFFFSDDMGKVPMFRNLWHNGVRSSVILTSAAKPATAFKNIFNVLSVFAEKGILDNVLGSLRCSIKNGQVIFNTVLIQPENELYKEYDSSFENLECFSKLRLKNGGILVSFVYELNDNPECKPSQWLVPLTGGHRHFEINLKGISGHCRLNLYVLFRACKGSEFFRVLASDTSDISRLKLGSSRVSFIFESESIGSFWKDLISILSNRGFEIVDFNEFKKYFLECKVSLYSELNNNEGGI